MKKSSHTTLAENVESVLLNFLRSQNMGPGDTLPREIELAERLQVSRHIVREGISRLKAIGLLESHKKRGTVLGHPEPFISLEKLVEAGFFSLHEKRDFMELRIAIELGMCDFVFARKTSEKIKKIRSLLGHKIAGIPTTEEELDFHSALMSFAGNRAATGFRNIIAMSFGSFRVNYSTQPITTVSHQAICDELESGTLESFREIMRKHFMPYFTEYTKK